MTLHLSYKYGGINLNPLWYGWGAARAGPANMAPRIAGEPTGSSSRGVDLHGHWRHCDGGVDVGPATFALVAPQSTGLYDQRQLEDSPYRLQRVSRLVDQVTTAEIWRGLKLYRSARPFFMGLIVGEITAAAIWLVIDYITGHTDSFLTQI